MVVGVGVAAVDGSAALLMELLLLLVLTRVFDRRMALFFVPVVVIASKFCQI